MGVQLTALPKYNVHYFHATPKKMPGNFIRTHLIPLIIIRNYKQKYFQLFKFIFFFCAAKTKMQLRMCTQPSFYLSVLCLS
jgi:hypothetical protein